ncbi:MAG: hypothetical protein GY859_28635, partial [Desulfobacterales bacterium]|nr:hypothetical protein [Desulfobacterales bacterium]
MEEHDPRHAHKCFLRIQAPYKNTNRLVLHLRDGSGNDGGGEFTVNPGRVVKGMGFTWADFLERYVRDDAIEDEFKAFGYDLFLAIIGETGLARAWSGVLAASDRRPLLMIAEFSRNTEAMAELPLEMLHDDANFVFARPGAGLERVLLGTPARDFIAPAEPNLLFAWACPPGAGDHFDPGPHDTALRSVFGDRVTVIENATLNAIEDALEKGAFDYIHILAHGYRDAQIAGVCLTGDNGGLDYVMAQRLANR